MLSRKRQSQWAAVMGQQQKGAIPVKSKTNLLGIICRRESMARKPSDCEMGRRFGAGNRAKAVARVASDAEDRDGDDAYGTRQILLGRLQAENTELRNAAVKLALEIHDLRRRIPTTVRLTAVRQSDAF